MRPLRGNCLVTLLLAVVVHSANAFDLNSFLASLWPFGPDLSVVKALDNTTFREFVKSNKVGLVEFWSPKCGWCKRLEPDYARAAAVLKDEGIPCAKVDVSVQEDLAKEFSIRGIPTFFWIDDEDVYEFPQARSQREILQNVKKMQEPAVTEVGEDPLPSQATGIPTVTIFAPELPKAFERLAKKQRSLAEFFHVEIDATDKVRVVFRHEKEDPIEVLDADFSDFEVLKGLWAKNEFPLFGQFGPTTLDRYNKRETKSGEELQGLIWILFDIDKLDNLVVTAETHRALATDIAKHYKDLYSVGWIDTSQFKTYLNRAYGVRELPGILITKLDHRGNFDVRMFYKLEENLEAGKFITRFDEALASNSTKNIFKSEPVPDPANNTGPVYNVVGDTMKEMLFRPDADVLLEIYAAWCQLCKDLYRPYLEVAKAVHRVGVQDRLVIAKLNGIDNDAPIPGLTWWGFPLFFHFKAGQSNWTTLPFEGHSFGTIMGYLRENHSMPEVRKALEDAIDESDQDEPDDVKSEL